MEVVQIQNPSELNEFALYYLLKPSLRTTSGFLPILVGGFAWGGGTYLMRFHTLLIWGFESLYKSQMLDSHLILVLSVCFPVALPMIKKKKYDSVLGMCICHLTLSLKSFKRHLASIVYISFSVQNFMHGHSHSYLVKNLTLVL